MSMVEVLIGASSPPPADLVSSGLLAGGALAVVLFDIERWGMSLMLLYRDCLASCESEVPDQ